MLLQIESVTLSKSGKSYWVKTNAGKGYASKAMGIEQAAGRAIEAVIGSWKVGNEDVPTIASFEFLEAPAAAPQAMPKASQITPIGVPGTDRWWLAFVSNQVAHAIEAGLIKQPLDMEPWAKAAYQAINNADDIAF